MQVFFQRKQGTNPKSTSWDLNSAARLSHQQELILPQVPDKLKNISSPPVLWLLTWIISMFKSTTFKDLARNKYSPTIPWTISIESALKRKPNRKRSKVKNHCLNWLRLWDRRRCLGPLPAMETKLLVLRKQSSNQWENSYRSPLAPLNCLIWFQP